MYLTWDCLYFVALWIRLCWLAAKLAAEAMRDEDELVWRACVHPGER